MAKRPRTAVAPEAADDEDLAAAGIEAVVRPKSLHLLSSGARRRRRHAAALASLHDEVVRARSFAEYAHKNVEHRRAMDIYAGGDGITGKEVVDAAVSAAEFEEYAGDAATAFHALRQAASGKRSSRKRKTRVRKRAQRVAALSSAGDEDGEAEGLEGGRVGDSLT